MKDNKRIFQVASVVDGISPLKDKGMSIRFHTKELSEDEKVLLISFYQKYGWLVFSEDSVQEELLPEQDTDVEGRRVKTPSQRLRSTIYVYGKQLGKPGEEFDTFYRHEMEKLINYYKNKLD